MPRLIELEVKRCRPAIHADVRAERGYSLDKSDRWRPDSPEEARNCAENSLDQLGNSVKHVQPPSDVVVSRCRVSPPAPSGLAIGFWGGRRNGSRDHPVRTSPRVRPALHVAETFSRSDPTQSLELEGGFKYVRDN
ncbi:hypothetical protein GORHZ_135_00340 [Gordonia rhizosphera NBRC 16068]|uniref:Uncharacterized protein n=1 Tax=Gordonia rhizosphera NBRC 16068 TaxID=1108045 RepID=K6WCM7_9ACTN|nr:hypothetical protein GORHZ_135_00340 [Gordonia rhizosphera NBRC 16068]